MKRGPVNGWIAILFFLPTAAFADAPPGRYAVSAGTVKDNRTGLVWQQNVDTNLHTWADARDACSRLTLLGIGWRLPTKKELLTLIDPTRFQPAIDPHAFPNTSSEYFWTATVDLADTNGEHWSVRFSDGRALNKVAMSCVRCVR